LRRRIERELKALSQVEGIIADSSQVKDKEYWNNGMMEG